MKEQKAYNWTTPKGANIEMAATVEHITRKTVNADGHEIDVNCSEWTYSIDSLKVNGETTPLRELNYNFVTFKRVGRDKYMVELPANIANDLYGSERAEQARSRKAEQKYQDHYNAVAKMMSE